MAENKTQPRAVAAYEILLERITNGELLPGTPLVENDLCQQLGMSRTPIREALNRLREAGMVDYFPARGNFVAVITKERVRQIYEAIDGLESMLSYLVARDHEPEGLASLEQALRGMEEAVAGADWEAWVVADRNFHEALYACCTNKYIVDQLQILARPSQQVRMLITKTFVDKSVSTSDHRKLYDAIVLRDREAAREVAHRHFSWLTEQMMKFLDQYSLY